MADIGSITQGASYRGDANLGGRFSQGVTIDTTPLSKLAAFTYYRDQNFWEQKQRDDKAAAQEIADMTAFDVTSPLKGYADHLKTKVHEIRDFIRDNPNALNYNKDPKGFQKFKELEGEFQNARKAANTSEVIYNARKTAADKAATPEAKDVALSRLNLDVDELFQNGVEGALNNTLKSASELNADQYKLPEIPITQRIHVDRNANDNQINKFKFVDPAQLATQADAVMLGFRKPMDKTSERWKNLSPAQQEQEEKEYNLTSAPRIGIQRVTDEFNGLIGALKAQNPQTKVIDIPEDQISSQTLAATISSIKAYNEYIDKVNANTGEKYKHMNIDDGLSGSEVIQLEAFQKGGKTWFTEEDKDVLQTDNAIQRDQQAIGWFNANTGRMQAQTQAAGGTGNSQTMGNALDAFKNDTYKNFKVQDGLFLNKDVTPKTGQVVVTKGVLPSQIVTAAEAAKIDLPIKNVTIEVENGVVVGVLDKKGNRVDRQLIENGQKKFDTEAKGQQKTQWGAGNTGKSVSQPAAKKYSAKMPDGSIVTSIDGKTWVDSKGKKVQ
jgi:hypothetical protein